MSMERLIGGMLQLQDRLTFHKDHPYYRETVEPLYLEHLELFRLAGEQEQYERFKKWFDNYKGGANG